MKYIMICPKCKSIAYYNSYFQTFICEKCAWMYEKPVYF